MVPQPLANGYQCSILAPIRCRIVANEFPFLLNRITSTIERTPSPSFQPPRLA